MVYQTGQRITVVDPDHPYYGKQGTVIKPYGQLMDSTEIQMDGLSDYIVLYNSRISMGGYLPIEAKEGKSEGGIEIVKDKQPKYNAIKVGDDVVITGRQSPNGKKTPEEWFKKYQGKKGKVTAIRKGSGVDYDLVTIDGVNTELCRFRLDLDNKQQDKEDDKPDREIKVGDTAIITDRKFGGEKDSSNEWLKPFIGKTGVVTDIEKSHKNPGEDLITITGLQERFCRFRLKKVLPERDKNKEPEKKKKTASHLKDGAKCKIVNYNSEYDGKVCIIKNRLNQDDTDPNLDLYKTDAGLLLFGFQLMPVS